MLTALFAVGGYGAYFLYRNLPCDATLSRQGFFLGYCDTTRFGDYEHGALVYGFEPGFADNVRRADVLFLGESKLQTAVSTVAVRDYFAAKGLRFYAFGFGFNETEQFPLAMLQRIGAHPQAVVINADGFFSDRMSPVADALLGGSPLSRLETYLRYQPKRWLEAVHARVCEYDVRLCRYAPAPRSWARSIIDGHWVWNNGDPNRVIRRVTAQHDRTNDPQDLARQSDLARRVVPLLRLNPSCVILTGVPNPITDAEGAARSLAGALNLPLAQPPVDGLSTRDEAHLNELSAERWSAALVGAIDPLLERCRVARSR